MQCVSKQSLNKKTKQNNNTVLIHTTQKTKKSICNKYSYIRFRFWFWPDLKMLFGTSIVFGIWQCDNYMQLKLVQTVQQHCLV